MLHEHGHPIPSPNQEILLKACLLKGEQAITAFRQWIDKVDFEKDVESGSFRLLPLLYHNLRNHDVSDDLMPRLRGIYRNSWSKNHILFYKAGKIIQFLESNGVHTLVMKGIPLSFLTYKNYAIRPMADVDILIPYSKARSTIELLISENWNLHDPQYLEHSLKYGRSATFSNAENIELDLHWHPIFEAHGNITEDDFWDHSVPFSFSGGMTRSFCATDQLFHTIVHGLRYNPEPPVRWVADAFTLIHDPDNAIDWERLLLQTKKFKVHLQVNAGLGYLVDVFHAKVPDQVQNDLAQLKSTFAGRLVYKHAISCGDKVPQTLRQKLFSVYAGFLRQTSKTGFWGQHIEFSRYLRFRTRGKPYFKILIYYMSLLFQAKIVRNKTY